MESIEFLDLDMVVGYVTVLKNATTAAKVGFFLERNRDALMVEEDHLNIFRKMRPRQPHYLIRGKRRGGHWVREWNLMVPDEILNKSWAEVL